MSVQGKKTKALSMASALALGVMALPAFAGTQSYLVYKAASSSEHAMGMAIHEARAVGRTLVEITAGFSQEKVMVRTLDAEKMEKRLNQGMSLDLTGCANQKLISPSGGDELTTYLECDGVKGVVFAKVVPAHVAGSVDEQDLSSRPVTGRLKTISYDRGSQVSYKLDPGKA